MFYITIDITVIILGSIHETARTGIYRFVSNICREFELNDNLTIVYSHMYEHQDEQANDILKNKNSAFLKYGKVLKPSEVDKSSIFYSPFYPIPDHLFNNFNVITIYDLIPIKFPHFFAHAEDQTLINTIKSIGPNDIITVISQCTKNDLLSYRKDLNPSNILVTHLGASDIFSNKRNDQLHSLLKYGIQDDDNFILSVATLEPRKNLLHLVTSFIDYKTLYDDNLKLVLCGTKGWNYDDIFKIVENRVDYIKDIILTGFVDDQDLPFLYSRAKIFIFMSQYEGFGLPVLEAMKCGCPVICSDNSSLPEIVGDSAIKIHHSDKDLLISSIRELIINDDLREHLSLQCFERSQSFSWDKCAAQTINAFDLSTKNYICHAIDKSNNTGSIVIDAVFFEKYKTGITRVWREILSILSTLPISNQIIILDRNKTAPRFANFTYHDFPSYDGTNIEHDRFLVEEACIKFNSKLFISTYFTMPKSTHSLLMVHDLIPEFFNQEITSTSIWKDRLYAFFHSNHFFCVSRNTQKDLIHYYPHIKLDNTTVSHCGKSYSQPSKIDVSNIKQKYNITKPYYLVVGERKSYKNAISFFKAFEKFGLARKNFLIVCSGPVDTLEDDFKSYIGDADILIHFFDDTEMPSLYAGAIALVYPSLYEGFGLPVLEAMSCGCPVITTTNGSLKEVGGDAVIYVNSNDIDAIYSQMKRVRVESFRKILISKGLTQSLKFNWQTMVNDLQSTILKVLNNHSSPKKVSISDQINIAYGLHTNSKFQESQSFYLSALKDEPNNFIANHMYGVLLSQLNDFDSALSYLFKAYSLDPNHSDLCANISSVFLRQGDIENSLKFCNLSLSIDPENNLALSIIKLISNSQAH